jgi:glycosyltransferase involved in cell wall biosynthesis
MNTPAVSVLMPVLNPHPVYFPEAVRSILSQSFTDWELVIVEDPSPSSAAELLKQFSDSRIRHFSNPERTGLIAQENRALFEARADLVAMLDQDDVAEPNRLADEFAFLTTHPEIALVGCQVRIIDSSGTVVGRRNYPTRHDEILWAMPRYNAVAQPGVMVRKAAMVRCGGYDLGWLAGDYDLWSRMLLAGEKFANIERPLLRYRVHPDSASKGTRIRTMLQLTGEIKRRYWWDRMTWLDRLRYWGERALLVLPPRLVTRLFAALTYRRPAV